MALRVAYFTLPLQGHVSPTVPVIRALSSRGAELHAIATEPYVRRLEAAGATVGRYPDGFVELTESPPPNPLKVAVMLAALTEDRLLEFAIGVLEDQRPDVVLLDSMAPWGRLAARRLGLPAVTSTSSFLFHGGMAASAAEAARLARSAAGAAPSLARLAGIRHRLRRQGADPGGPITLLSNCADATLVYTSRELQPGADRFGDDVHFVGATLGEPATRPRTGALGDAATPPTDSAAAELLAQVGPGPLAYVSLGTIYNDRATFLRACIDGLSGDGRTVVVATGTRIPAGALGRLPDGVHAVPFAPQLALLERADLFVTHGGMNSVTEALWHGVPMLAFPQAADQPLVAARIEALGAGVRLTGREPSAGQIRERAAELLGGGAAARAAALGDGLRDGGGAEAAADLIARVSSFGLPRPVAQPGS